MSIEARVLLADVKKYGAEVYLDNGQPRLRGSIPANLKVQLKQYRDEIIQILGGTLFVEEKVQQPTAIDVIGRKDKVKSAETVDQPHVPDWWGHVVCERCYHGTRGRIAKTVYGYLGTEVVMEIGGKWYCRDCYQVAFAEFELSKLLEKAPKVTREPPDRIGLIDKWDYLA